MAAVSLALGLILCEAILRLFSPQVSRLPLVWGYDARLGWNHIPGASGRLMSPEFDVEVRINAAGLRDREYARARPENVCRILVFGDSFAEGWGVPLQDAVSETLERDLNNDDGTAFEVLNFGVAGFGTDQQLLQFRQHGQHFQPDEVLVLFYANDLWNNRSRRGIGMERGYKPYFHIGDNGELTLRGVPVRKSEYWDAREGKWQRPLSQRLGRYLFEHWHLFAMVSKASSSPRVPGKRRAQYYSGVYGRADTGAAEGWRLTEAILVEFDRAVAEVGAQLHLVYVPAIVQVEEDNWALKKELHGLAGDDFDLGKPNRSLREIADRNGIPFLDLTQRFVAQARTQSLYYRDSHWNAAGHAQAAAAIGVHLRQLDGRRLAARKAG